MTGSRHPALTRPTPLAGAVVRGTHRPPEVLRRRLLCTTMLTSAALLASSPTFANPQGGIVVGGEAAISQAPGVTTVDQSSHKAIVNWQSFSIDQGELTKFNQPNQDSIALNRVVGKNPSAIFGKLQANGHVWLVNPSGVLFGPSAQVDVHGIVATTSDIPDADFLAGKFNFSIPSPNADASVINQGTISLSEHGLAGLVAPHVRNDGVIVGKLGQVVLAGAPTFTLDFEGDGLIQFQATSKVVESLEASGALVRNAEPSASRAATC